VTRLIQSTEAMNRKINNKDIKNFYSSGMFYICFENKIVKFYWKIRIKNAEMSNELCSEKWSTPPKI